MHAACDELTQKRLRLTGCSAPTTRNKHSGAPERPPSTRDGEIFSSTRLSNEWRWIFERRNIVILIILGGCYTPSSAFSGAFICEEKMVVVFVSHLAVVSVTLLRPSAHSWHFFLLKENTTTGSRPSFSSFLMRACHWFLSTIEASKRDGGNWRWAKKKSTMKQTYRGYGRTYE